MGVSLFPHNEKAYKALVETFKTEKITSINHATGTGKSFITLKYLYDNRNKRILYVTPNYHIYNQLVDEHMHKLGINKSDFTNFDNIIYANLGKKDITRLVDDYDIIVFDEYHRCGARIWSKYAFKIRDLVLESDDKKLLGLTATSRRYLDHDREMRDELFMCKCASYLDLSESIIEGILPCPMYINTVYSLIETANVLKEKIEKKVHFEPVLTEALNDVDLYLKKLNDLTKDNIFLPYMQKDDGKYIIFSSQIGEIKKNIEFIKNCFPGLELNFFEVHSHQKPEKNEAILSEFRRSKKGLNFLCVVDILNEGIHVDGISGIFMMRHTQSPIIYFQQLGRLLSFSGRRDKLVVWDLVGNLTSHEVIRDLYHDVLEEANEKIKIDKDNREVYENIIDNFKIVDKTGQLNLEMDALKLKYNNEALINLELKGAITILLNANGITPDVILAHITIFKYYKYLTLEEIRLLKKHDILLPKVLSTDMETLTTYFEGTDSLKELRQKKNDYYYELFMNFYYNNSRVPLLTTEPVLTCDLTDSFNKMPKKKLNDIMYIIKNQPIDAYNKVAYALTIGPSEYPEFFNILKQELIANHWQNNNIRAFLRSFNSSQFFKGDYLPYLKVYQNEAEHPDYIYNKMEDFFAKHDNSLPSYSEDSEEKSLFLELYAKSTKVVNNFKRIAQTRSKFKGDSERDLKDRVEKYFFELVNYVYDHRALPQEGSKEYEKYCYYAVYIRKYGYMEYVLSLLTKFQEEDFNQNKEDIYARIITFLDNNYGDFPSINALDVEEVRLASFFNELKSYYSEEELTYLTTYSEEKKEKCIYSSLDLYLNFINVKKRFPLLDASDPEEQEIAIRFKRIEDTLTTTEQAHIKRTLQNQTKKLTYKNTFREILRKEFNNE